MEKIPAGKETNYIPVLLTTDGKISYRKYLSDLKRWLFRYVPYYIDFELYAEIGRRGIVHAHGYFRVPDDATTVWGLIKRKYERKFGFLKISDKKHGETGVLTPEYQQYITKDLEKIREYTKLSSEDLKITPKSCQIYYLRYAAHQKEKKRKSKNILKALEIKSCNKEST